MASIAFDPRATEARQMRAWRKLARPAPAASGLVGWFVTAVGGGIVLGVVIALAAVL